VKVGQQHLDLGLALGELRLDLDLDADDDPPLTKRRSGLPPASRTSPAVAAGPEVVLEE
jgi:hypothetical protein